jgi:hypothetical protein
LNYRRTKTLASTFLQVCFALPIYQVINLTVYVRAQDGWAAKSGTALAMLPILAITAGCWLTAWAIFLWLIFAR